MEQEPSRQIEADESFLLEQLAGDHAGVIVVGRVFEGYRELELKNQQLELEKAQLEAEKARLLAEAAKQELENAELKRMATTDSLTGLPNRHLFDNDIRWGATAHAPTGEHLSNRPVIVGRAIAMMDLDHFKTINDTMGHSQGDRVLRMSAMALRLLHREGDKVYRLGGDEFASLMPLYEPTEDHVIPEDGMFARQLKERFLQEISLIRDGRYKAALMLHDLELTDLDKQALDILDASFGVVTQLGNVVNYNEMLARADALMYAMKKSRPNKR